MTDETYTLQLTSYDRERTLDWLTALVPLLLISIFYYGWQAVLLELLAVGGYLAVSALFSGSLATVRLAPALVTGLLVAFCLPATTPYWPAALAGGVAALAAAIPSLVEKRWPTCPYADALVPPAMIGYLAVRLLFPGTVNSFTLPAQWDSLDGLATATPLATLGSGDISISNTHLLFGIHAGAIGEGCVAAVLLTAFYLLLRRRLRLIAPAALLATVSLLSWWVWGAPLCSILVGGTALGVLLLADRAYMPKDYATQAVSGITAGGMIVLLRSLTHTDGTAIALVAVGVLQPVLPFFFHFCHWAWGMLSPILARFWALLKLCFGKLWQQICRHLGKFKEKLTKNKNNG